MPLRRGILFGLWNMLFVRRRARYGNELSLGIHFECVVALKRMIAGKTSRDINHAQ